MATKAGMKDEKLKAALEEVAGLLSVKVSYEKIKIASGRQPKGGLCWVHGEPRIIVHKLLPESEKVQVLIEALRGFDLENVYISPEIRRTIEGVSLL